MYILEVSVGKMSYWVMPGDPSDWGLKHVMLVDTQEWDGDRVGLKRSDDIANTLKGFRSQVNKIVALKKDYQSRGIDCYLHFVLKLGIRLVNFVVVCHFSFSCFSTGLPS